MTSETLYILQQIASALVAESITFTECYTGAFLDINGDDKVVYLRDQGTTQELTRWGVDDRLMPLLYFRFRGRESWPINPNERQLQSDKRRQLEQIPVRLVAFFEGENMFEVADKLKNDLLSVNVLPFGNVDSVRIDQTECFIDYLNGWPDEADGLREYIPTAMSVAIDMTINYWRSGGCRNPEDLVL